MGKGQSTLKGGSKGDSKSSSSSSAPSKTHDIKKKLNGASTALISTSNHPATASNVEALKAWPDCMLVKPVNEIVKNYLAYDVLTSLSSIQRFYIWSKDDITIYQAHTIARDLVLKADGKPAKSKATVVVIDEKNPDASLSVNPFAALDAAVAANPRVLEVEVTVTVQRNGVDHTFKGTLEQIAMANLGFTIKSENDAKPMVSKGRAERLRELRESLLSDTVPLALEQARLALLKKEDAKAI